MKLLGEYVVQRTAYTDKKGSTHNRRICTLPSWATIEMGVDAGNTRDRTVKVYYDEIEETIIIKKK